jgi:hypothetical protein
MAHEAVWEEMKGYGRRSTSAVYYPEMDGLKEIARRQSRRVNTKL